MENAPIERQNICCPQCSSLIEIFSFSNNEIKYKCQNKTIHNNKFDIMSIENYLKIMKIKDYSTINEDNCEIHEGNKYIFYCFDCRRHLCEECLKTRNHIAHIKDNIFEIQPNKNELKKINNYIEEKVKDNDIKKLLELIYNTYDSYKHNYFNILNINNLYSNFILNKKNNIEKDIKEKEELLKEKLEGEYRIEIEKKYNNAIVELTESFLTSFKQREDFYENEKKKLRSNEITIRYKINKRHKFKIIYDLSENWNIQDFKNKNKEFLEIKLKAIDTIENISCMFYKCESLYSLTGLENLDISYVTDIHSLFNGCKSLSVCSGIEKWDTSKITSFYAIFAGCSSLANLPDISNWNTENVLSMENMFTNCSSLKNLPEISKWNINNVKSKKNMFSGTNSNLNIPPQFLE